MMQNKRIIGITGGSGSGKSYISDELRKRGFAVIDADKTAHESINNAMCIKELLSVFGGGILKNGTIDRKELGKIVFSEPEKLEILNKITHKYILSDIASEIEQAEGSTVFVDGAVLIESGMELDAVIGILADRDVRISRIMARDSIPEQEAKTRVLAQQPDEFYVQNCDFVVTNNGGEIDIPAILKRVIK